MCLVSFLQEEKKYRNKMRQIEINFNNNLSNKKIILYEKVDLVRFTLYHGTFYEITDYKKTQLC